MLEKWKNESKIKKIADIFGIIVILSGIGVSIYMNTVNRSLWLDEAYLVSSLLNRSFWNLTSMPLDYIQSAPIIYIYIIKVFIKLFGSGEGVLRLFSIICYAFTLFLSYYVSKKLFACKYPLLCAAFVANIDFLVRYSNVFKPYVSECVWVLLVLLVYYWYREEKIKWWMMAVLYMIFIWGANPVCFFIGGVLTCEFLQGVFGKERNKIWQSIVSGVGILSSFVFYYFYWLKAAAQDDFMQNYWVNDRYPFIPKNGEDLEDAWKMIRRLFAVCNEELRYLILALVLGAFVAGILWKKNRYCSVLLIGFILALFASSLYMFPVRDRIWTFCFPLLAILAFYFIDIMLIREGSFRTEIFALLIMVTAILANDGIKTYMEKEEIYWEYNEVNPLLDYVRENIKEDEMVYVYHNSIPVVTYKNGYGVNRIGNVSRDNVLWGTSTMAEADKDMIMQTDKCYIITSQAADSEINPLLDYLGANGTVDVVLDVYGTRLYYFSK